MKLLRTFQFFVVVLMAVCFAGAIYTSTLIGQRQKLIQKSARYNIAWLAGQASVEVSRLTQAVAGFGVPGSDISRDDVQLKLDIVDNRLRLMNSGDFDAFVKADPERQVIVNDLGNVLSQVQGLLERSTDPKLPLHLMSMLEPLDKRLSRLASAANVYGGERVDADQHMLLELHWAFSTMIAGLVIGCIALMAIMLWNFRVLKRTNGELQVIAGSLEQTKIDLETANQGIQTANAELNLHNQILKMRDNEMRTQNVRFDAALNNMSHGLCMAGADSRLIVCNNQFRQLFNIDQETARPGTAIAALMVRMGVALKLGESGTMGLMREHDAIVSARTPAAFTRDCPDGRSIAVHHQPMVDGGWVATYEDITERRKAEEQISHMAHHDALTGLPNRAYFLKHLEEALAKMRRGESNCAVLCLDLDRFKAVNDTLGHPVGDLLLKQVSQRLQAAVQKEDVVARFGGDEFAILKNCAVEHDALAQLGQLLVKSISTPFMLDGHEVSVGTSVGIAIGFQDGTSSEQLLKNADLALYHSKSEGRGNYHFFEARMDAKMQARRLVEMDLRRALPGNELELHYQPQVNLASNRITGFESLIRWRHAEKGMISPVEFVPIAEEVGLIIPIGEWVLREACTAALNWPADVRVAVNLSPVQFRDRNLVNVVRNVLAKTGLQARRLELEITETALVQDMDVTVGILHQFRDLGVRISLDDFGTGYSSLSYLRSFPFDKIKIDKSFVRDSSTRPDCLAIVKSVASLGQSLGMTTTAEGVETEEQLNLIRQMGCTDVQGYYYSRPLPRPEAEALLGRFNGHPAAPAIVAA
ncbi:MAG: EAL domain-containing protein [Proteobacteria bacterium]|nr:EAL domain-containing protein [Pseudomonadota bacterium]